jgi:hypothetical protein
MWPSLSRSAKAADANQQRWDAMLKRQRDNRLRDLREANANLGKGRR